MLKVESAGNDIRGWADRCPFGKNVDRSRLRLSRKSPGSRTTDPSRLLDLKDGFCCPHRNLAASSSRRRSRVGSFPVSRKAPGGSIEPTRRKPLRAQSATHRRSPARCRRFPATASPRWPRSTTPRRRKPSRSRRSPAGRRGSRVPAADAIAAKQKEIRKLILDAPGPKATVDESRQVRRSGAGRLALVQYEGRRCRRGFAAAHRRRSKTAPIARRSRSRRPGASSRTPSKSQATSASSRRRREVRRAEQGAREGRRAVRGSASRQIDRRLRAGGGRGGRSGSGRKGLRDRHPRSAEVEGRRVDLGRLGASDAHPKPGEGLPEFQVRPDDPGEDAHDESKKACTEAGALPGHSPRGLGRRPQAARRGKRREAEGGNSREDLDAPTRKSRRCARSCSRRRLGRLRALIRATTRRRRPGVPGTGTRWCSAKRMSSRSSRSKSG